MRPPHPLRRFGPSGRLAGVPCFPISPETMCSAWRRRGCGCAGRAPRTRAAIHRFCSQWEVARYTARIPHPYPPGSAERFIYAAPRSQRFGAGPDARPDADQGQARRPSARSASRSRGTDRLTLGYVLGAGVWGNGLATEAVRRDGRRLPSRLTPGGRDPRQRPDRECGLAAGPGEVRIRARRHGARGRAGARAGSSSATVFACCREAWTDAVARAAPRLALGEAFMSGGGR